MLIVTIFLSVYLLFLYWMYVVLKKIKDDTQLINDWITEYRNDVFYNTRHIFIFSEVQLHHVDMCCANTKKSAHNHVINRNKNTQLRLILQYSKQVYIYTINVKQHVQIKIFLSRYCRNHHNTLTFLLNFC